MPSLFFQFRALLSLLLVLAFSYQAQAQDIRSLTVEAFLEEFNALDDNQTYLLNFWATWCGPCVKELPYFEAVHQDPDSKVKVVLVSLDFANAEERLTAFAQRREIDATIIYLTDWSSQDGWIEQMSEDWTGAIPVSILYQAASKSKTVWLTAFESEEELREWIADPADKLED